MHSKLSWAELRYFVIQVFCRFDCFVSIVALHTTWQSIWCAAHVWTNLDTCAVIRLCRISWWTRTQYVPNLLWWLMIAPYKGPVTRKCLPLMTSSYLGQLALRNSKLMIVLFLFRFLFPARPHLDAFDFRMYPREKLGHEIEYPDDCLMFTVAIFEIESQWSHEQTNFEGFMYRYMFTVCNWFSISLWSLN